MINVSSWQDLYDIRNNLTEDYALTRNLYIDDEDYVGIGDNFTPIGFSPISDEYDEFTGSFDGNGFIIYGLNINKTTEPGDDYIGLFSCIGVGGVVENIQLINGNINGYAAVGSIAGRNEGTISDCVNGSNILFSYTGGGIAALNAGSVLRCKNLNNISVYTGFYCGGIVGWNEGGGLVSNCYNLGNIENYYFYTAGIVGANDNNATVENCYNFGDISGQALDIGGVVGINNIVNAYIQNCFNAGKVSLILFSPATFIGGVLGYNLDPTNNSVINCGWFTDAGGDAVRAIGYPLADVTHESSDIADFYDRDFGYESGVSDGLYRESDSSYLWESPPWYWRTDGLPQIPDVLIIDDSLIVTISEEITLIDNFTLDIDNCVIKIISEQVKLFSSLINKASYITNVNDLGFVATFSLSVDITISIADTLAFNSDNSLKFNSSSSRRFSGREYTGTVIIKIKTSEDNIEWSDWVNFQKGDYICRYFQLMISIDRPTQSAELVISKFDYLADLPDIHDRGDGEVISAGDGVDILFNKEYHQNPVVNISIITGTGIYHRISDKSITGCNVKLYDATGSAVVGEFEYHAFGI